MKIAVVGAKGMLGTDVVQAAANVGHEVVEWDLPDIDICNFSDLRKRFKQADWVINCAAYTKVDAAEQERRRAFAVNAEGPRNLAVLAARWRMRLMHISTDYVFDGLRHRPYVETDATDPINVYGASKLAGEKNMRATEAEILIVRTQSLYGANGNNFVDAIVHKLQQTDEPVKVVDDQISAPTYTLHLADALLRLAELNETGLLHVAANGECSWYDCACKIAEYVKPDAEIIPIPASDLAQPAKRPAYSVLNSQRYTSRTDHMMPDWTTGLEEYLAAKGLLV